MTEQYIAALSEDCRNLLAACKAASKDDMPRLVLADAIQEAGDEDLGQYIRLACEWARVWREPGGYRYKVLRAAARLHANVCRRHGWTPVPPDENKVRKATATAEASASAVALEATVTPVRGAVATLRSVRGFVTGVHVEFSSPPGLKRLWAFESSGQLWFGRCRLCELNRRFGTAVCEHHGEAGPAAAGPALVAEHPFLSGLSFVSVAPKQIRGREAEGWWWLLSYGPEFVGNTLPDECSDFWPDESVGDGYRMVTSATGVTHVAHPTREGAMRTMSTACLAWALAKLVPTCESEVSP